MLIIPAVDLKNAKVVRLFKGEYDKEKIYSQEPEEVARYWQKEGAELIHVVDLDGAVSGAPKNVGSLKKIINAVSIPVQFGGGVRSKQVVEELFSLGVAKVMLGTIALEGLALLENLYAKYGEKIVVSVDISKEGGIALKGWTQTKEEKGLVIFCKTLKKIGIKQIIYTDIERDGTLLGARVYILENYLNVLKALRIEMQVIFAGGVSSLEDIESLKKLEKKGLAGIIVG